MAINLTEYGFKAGAHIATQRYSKTVDPLLKPGVALGMRVLVSEYGTTKTARLVTRQWPAFARAMVKAATGKDLAQDLAEQATAQLLRDQAGSAPVYFHGDVVSFKWPLALVNKESERFSEDGAGGNGQGSRGLDLDSFLARIQASEASAKAPGNGSAGKGRPLTLDAINDAIGELPSVPEMKPSEPEHVPAPEHKPGLRRRI